MKKFMKFDQVLFSRKIKSINTKVVLYVILKLYNVEGWSFTPIKRITDKTGFSCHTVSKSIDELVSLNLITLSKSKINNAFNIIPNVDNINSYFDDADVSEFEGEDIDFTPAEALKDENTVNTTIDTIQEPTSQKNEQIEHNSQEVIDGYNNIIEMCEEYPHTDNHLKAIIIEFNKIVDLDDSLDNYYTEEDRKNVIEAYSKAENTINDFEKVVNNKNTDQPKVKNKALVDSLFNLVNTFNEEAATMTKIEIEWYKNKFNERLNNARPFMQKKQIDAVQTIFRVGNYKTHVA